MATVERNVPEWFPLTWRKCSLSSPARKLSVVLRSSPIDPIGPIEVKPRRLSLPSALIGIEASESIASCMSAGESVSLLGRRRRSRVRSERGWGLKYRYAWRGRGRG